jgi:hypothetical protein
MEKIFFYIPVIIFIITSGIYTDIQAREPYALPRKIITSSASSPSTPTVNSRIKNEDFPELINKPRILMELHTFRIVLKDEFKFGTIWKKAELEKYLGKPLKGRMLPSMDDKSILTVENLLIKNPDKMLDFFSSFGDAKLLYKKRWSQIPGEQSSQSFQSVIPYTVSFKSPSSTTYTQSTVKTGMNFNLTVSGLQISGDSPAADIIYEIKLKDAYKTKDGLFAVNDIDAVDITSVPLSHTLIQSSIFNNGNVCIEYIFLITPRKIR